MLEQLVVPKPFRSRVLHLAHSHVLGGHLGAAKTQEQVSQRFFWPGVDREIKVEVHHKKNAPKNT